MATDSQTPTVDLLFAADRIALLRRVPEYTGDTTGAIAMLSPTPPAPATAIARIPLPIEQDDLRLIAPSDTLSLNNNRYEYPITLVTKIPATGGAPPFLDITVDVSEYPDPTALLTAGVQFVVNRSPRVLRSSEVTLPADYIIDLRFSGFDSTDSVLPGASPLIPGNVPGFNSTVFELAPAIPNSAITGVVNFVNQPIAVLFNQDGAVSQMGVNTTVFEPPSGGGPPEAVDYAYTTRAQGRLFLFVTEYDPDSISAGTPSNPLLNDRNLWVSASSTNGTVNVGTNSTSDLPAGLTIDELSRRYLGTFTGGSPNDMFIDRNVFNGFISSARSDSVSASAVQ